MFSEFAYSHEMQLVLMGIAFVCNSAQLYFLAQLILRIHGEKANIMQKISFAVLTGAVIYTLFIYGIYYIGGMLSFSPLTYLLIVTPNPIMALLFCLLGIYILKLSPVRSIEIMGNVYLYYVILISVNRLVGSIFFVQTDARYNYLLDGVRNLVYLALFFSFYALTCVVLDKKPSLVVPKTNVFVDRKKDWVFFFLKALLVYLCCVSLPSLIPNAIVTNVVILVLLCFLLVSTILYTNYVHARSDSRNKEAHINSMIRTTEEFRAIKHDFYNILQTYGGYLAVGDLAACRRYHEKFTHMTIWAGESLDLSRRMNENPALISLLIDKRARASTMNVDFDISIKCPLSDLKMDDIDLSRVLSCLIDNGIEAAVDSEQRRVTFSIEQKPDNSKLMMITNSTEKPPDMNQIFAAGVTSKQGHQGIGLSNVRRIIDKYGNCTFQLYNYDNEMTAYVELRG